jgi:hypothetical protein
MSDHARRWRTQWIPPLAAMALLLAGSASAGAADEALSRPMCHAAGSPAVRSRSPIASAALEYGLKHSPSLQALVDSLHDTDIVAYIDSNLAPLGDIWGHTSFVAKSAHCRFVRVEVTAHLNLGQAAALIGHELQHVYEIATHPEVVDDATLSAMYQQIGRRSRYENAYDSVEAIEMGNRVAAEIYNSGAVSARSSPGDSGR